MRPITERLSPVTKYLLLASTFVYLFYVAVPNLRGVIATRLALGPMVLLGDVWQPVTALLVHIDFISFLFNMVGLWFLGAPVERQFGRRRFLILFFLVGVVSNLVLAAWMWFFGTPLLAAGCGTTLLAMLAVFGTVYDRTPMSFFGALVLEARVIALLFLGFAVLANVARGTWPMLVADLVAMLMGYVMAGGRGEGLKRLWSSAHAKRVRRRYQVLEGGRRGTRPQDLN
jgi:membrane associated rhomboid family serine protease